MKLSDRGLFWIITAPSLIALLYFFPLIMAGIASFGLIIMIYAIYESEKFWKKHEEKRKKFENCGRPECANCTSCKGCNGHKDKKID